MKLLKYIVTTMLLLMTLVVAGCGEDKFVGTWYNKADNNVISKSIVTKDKNKEKTYNNEESMLYYAPEEVVAGTEANGRKIINRRYTWTHSVIATIPLTEKDGKLYGKFQNIDFNVEYNDKNKTLLCRNSKVPIVDEAINEKNFDLKKVQEELKAEITKKFNEEKAKTNAIPYRRATIGEIEFNDTLTEKEIHPFG
ncbi:hypothetical protein [uncultured Phascolarctobacterium sp.]|uniref:hypothetical protein n=1 Tax=uncultured Phascolarctobacterium sp. TaxID=512296 RepID=UPI0025DE3348|nr:hypothetical protein [uncultured Phascolarctobacterium sp.]